MSISLSAYASVHMSVCPPVHLPMSVCLTFHPSVHPFNSLFFDACPSIRPFMCLSILLFVRLSIHQFDMYSKPLLKPQYTYNKPCFETAYLSENTKIMVLVKSSPKCYHFWATFSDENHCQKIFLNTNTYLSRIFVPGKPFQPSLKLARKTGAYLSGTPETGLPLE
jgi:hypothetical protein